MQQIAADVGYSETAFLAPGKDSMEEGDWNVRYFSPLAEVPFCGHATIAAGVALGERFGSRVHRFATSVGDVPVDVRCSDDGVWATLTSVEPDSRPVPPTLLAGSLSLLGWSEASLDRSIPPALAFAGAWHLVLAASERETLARLEYDFDALKRLMLEHELTTLQLVHREPSEEPTQFRSRNPFPVGGIVEDPATGAAAAALGGYLRAAALCRTPTRLVVHQGIEMGRPSEIRVDVPESGGIRVTGTATAIS